MISVNTLLSRYVFRGVENLLVEMFGSGDADTHQVFQLAKTNDNGGGTGKAGHHRMAQKVDQKTQP